MFNNPNYILETVVEYSEEIRAQLDNIDLQITLIESEILNRVPVYGFDDNRILSKLQTELDIRTEPLYKQKAKILETAVPRYIIKRSPIKSL